MISRISIDGAVLLEKAVKVLVRRPSRVGEVVQIGNAGRTCRLLQEWVRKIVVRCSGPSAEWGKDGLGSVVSESVNRCAKSSTGIEQC